MASTIDHIVIAVADPDAAAAELSERVGIAFTGGGRHPGVGTFNRIAFLGDAYLELIGVDDAAAAQGWAVGRAALRVIEAGGGFATWALVDDEIRTTVAELQANGSGIGPVIHGSRERPDGEWVEWWTATDPELGPDRPPFLIQHLNAGAEWGAEAMASRRAFIHPIGSPLRLTSLTLSLPDPLGLAATCAREVGVEFQVVGEGAGASAAARIGPQRIVLTRGVRGDRGSRGPACTVTLFATGVVDRQTVSALGVEFEVRGAAGAA